MQAQIPTTVPPTAAQSMNTSVEAVPPEGSGRTEDNEGGSTGCCAQGGCCRQAPSKRILVDGQVVRMNMMYSTMRCFSRSPGVDNAYDQVPDILQARGLSQTLWSEYIGPNSRLAKDINGRFGSACACCAFAIPFMLIAGPFLVLTCCCCCAACKSRAKKVMAWDADFRAWQQDFNKVLKPYGAFVKTQSSCRAVHTDKGKQRHFDRWISLAVSPAEVAALQAEPHVMGDIENMQCCGGVNEAELCMHPPVTL